MTRYQLAAKLLTPGLKKFSDRHRGESCYIFGSGPSIKWFDLTCFRDRPALCSGLITFHRDFHELDVRYVTLVEPWFFVPRPLHPRKLRGFDWGPMVGEYREFIKRSPTKDFFVSLSNRFSVSGRNVHYVFRGLPTSRNRADAMLGRFDLFGGSFHAPVALAHYMGFTKIYLVGFDAWTIEPMRNIRFYERGEGQLCQPTREVPAKDFLDIVKEQAEIYTISLDGQSRNAKQISYTEYTGKAPRFKENHEFMDDRHLKMISLWAGYDIYGTNPRTSKDSGAPVSA
jgi:hypothetical protein